jgi:hypothetical protein
VRIFNNPSGFYGAVPEGNPLKPVPILDVVGNTAEAGEFENTEVVEANLGVSM